MTDDNTQNKKKVQSKSNNGKWEAAPLKSRLLGDSKKND